MRSARWSPPRRSLASLLLVLVAEPSFAAQEKAAAAPAVAPELREWLGTWSGSAKLTNEAGTSPCLYEGPSSPPSAKLDVTAEGGLLKGTLSLSAAPPAGSACPALEKTVEVRELKASGSSLTFDGPGKHTWTLGRRGRELLGTVSWQGTGSDDAGALRLSGEVRLQKAGHKGSAFGAAAGIVAANVVAVGALALANKAGKSQDSGPPQVTCSPRRCFLVALNEPCQCNTTSTTGQPCGNTTSGVGYAAACNVDGGEPCQAGLSCNSGICEDRFGHCPF